MIRPDDEIMRLGMDCLIRELGIVEAERFVTLAIRQSEFDYTEWQREHYDAMTPEQISREAADYAKKHPSHGRAVRT